MLVVSSDGMASIHHGYVSWGSHIPRHVLGSEFSGGFPGQLLLVLFVRNVAFGLQCRAEFYFLPLFEGLYRLPCYRCRYSGPIEIRNVVCQVVDCAGHHLWPEPLFCELRVDRC